VNQELEQYLRLYINHMQTDWVDWLSQAEFAYNNRIHSSTSYSPFYLEYGRHPHVPTALPLTQSVNPAAMEFQQELAHARKSAEMALQHSAETMKRFADLSRKDVNFEEYQIGQRVWLSTKNLNTGRPSKKLDAKRVGPFEIIKKISPLVYQLRLPADWKIHPVFHVSLLRPAKLDDRLHPEIIDDTLKPDPIIVGREEEYEVERIVRHQGGKRRRMFLVKWKGYPEEENTWEPRRNLSHARETVLRYEEALPVPVKPVKPVKRRRRR
jgi:hypothetical protein